MLPRSPRITRVLIVLMTAAALLGMPLQVAGHTPRGTQATLNASALTTAVSVGQSAAFEVFFRNNGPSTFTHVRLSGNAPGAVLASAPGGCSGSGAAVTCNFGELKSGKSLTLLFTFGGTASAGSIQFATEVKVDSGSDNRNASSKDTFRASATATVSDSPDFFGGWQPAHGSTLNFSTAGAGDNSQATTAQVPPVGTGYPVMLAEVDENIVCGTKVYTGIGDAVDMSIANGAELDPHLTVTLTYDKSAVGWTTPWTIKFVHQTNDGVCHFPPRGCNYHNDGFCYDAWWSGSGWHKKLVLRVELPTNGRGKGF
jgi:hypothetical protein